MFFFFKQKAAYELRISDWSSDVCSSDFTLGRRLVRLQCYEGLDVAAAVYEWNYPRQMVEIRVAEAAGEHDRARLSGDIFDERFLIERPLLQALRRDAAGAPVLLLDELDRSDAPFAAFPLAVLSDFQIPTPAPAPLPAAPPPPAPQP